MKEKCGGCKDYRIIRNEKGLKERSCAGWKACGFWIEIDPDRTPLENLERQNQTAWWLAFNVLQAYSDSFCFRSIR